jgi:hypothetical protein
MALTITLLPEMKARLQAEAVRAGLTLEQWAAQRLLETELLWRIRTAAPETETRELHRLLRRRSANTLPEPEKARLRALLDEREQQDVWELALRLAGALGEAENLLALKKRLHPTEIETYAAEQEHRGRKQLEALIQFGLGLILGDCVLGCFWAVVGASFNIPTFNVRP